MNAALQDPYIVQLAIGGLIAGLMFGLGAFFYRANRPGWKLFIAAGAMIIIVLAIYIENDPFTKTHLGQ